MRKNNKRLVILLFLCLLSIIFKPADVDKYVLIISSHSPIIKVIQEDTEAVKQDYGCADDAEIDVDSVNENTPTRSIFLYLLVVGLLTLVSFVLFGLLMIDVLKLQKIQKWLLELEQ